MRGSTAGMIGFGTIMGGVGAAITKGNFWQGAVTGFIVSALNHAMHDGDKEDPQQPPKKTAEQRQQEALDAWMSDMKDFNEFLLEARTLMAGFEFKMPSWSSLKSLFTLRVSSKLLVQFGKGENQVYHAFRHTEKLGLSTSAVKSAILKDIPRISSNVTYGGKTIYTQIKVGGQDIIYSAHRLQNGTINVGRITGL